MLKVNNISKTYPNNSEKVNDNISFTVPEGSMVWISGVTGSGKSTLLNMLSGIDIPDEGSVYWDKDNITEMSSSEKAEFRLHNMGIVFQSLELIKSQNVFDNISLPLHYMNYTNEQIKEKVNHICQYLDIVELTDKYPSKISGGQQQRVAIARALVHNPKYILGDEISSALDTKTAGYIYEKFALYIKENNAIGIFISHDPTIKEYTNIHYKIIDGVLEL